MQLVLWEILVFIATVCDKTVFSWPTGLPKILLAQEELLRFLSNRGTLGIFILLGWKVVQGISCVTAE